MTTTQPAIDDFLAQRRIAVVGVSRNKASPANAICQKLRDAGYEVFPVNPHTDEFQGGRCYRALADIQPPPDGVIIVTRPAVSAEIVDQSMALGIRRIWMHNMLGTGVKWGRKISRATTSVDEQAAQRAAAAGLTVIPGNCPMQHVEPVDRGHRCIRWLTQKLGNQA
jgi:uncharacterized protein